MSIRSLRLRGQDASLPNELRQHRQAAIRLIYFAAVLLLALWLGDMFLGSLFYLRSQGLVMAEPAVVAAEFSATVRALPVHEGDRVAEGQVVAVVDSQSVAESMARLTTERTDQALRLDDARIRSATVNAVLDLARTRRDIVADTRRRLELLVPPDSYHSKCVWRHSTPNSAVARTWTPDCRARCADRPNYRIVARAGASRRGGRRPAPEVSRRRSACAYRRHCRTPACRERHRGYARATDAGTLRR